MELLKKYLAGVTSAVPVLTVETGNLFRQFIAGDNYSSLLAREKNQAGQRGPSFLLIWMWTQFLVNNLRGTEHLVFDGASRSLIEAEALDTLMSFYSRPTPFVVYLDVGNETAIDRLTRRGRYDDLTPEAIRRRLDWFERDVQPVINYYRSHSGYRFLDINGEQPMDKVHQEIVSRLAS